jgi:hypothetical protein
LKQILKNITQSGHLKNLDFKENNVQNAAHFIGQNQIPQQHAVTQSTSFFLFPFPFLSLIFPNLDKLFGEIHIYRHRARNWEEFKNLMHRSLEKYFPPKLKKPTLS